MSCGTIIDGTELWQRKTLDKATPRRILEKVPFLTTCNMGIILLINQYVKGID